MVGNLSEDDLGECLGQSPVVPGHRIAGVIEQFVDARRQSMGQHRRPIICRFRPSRHGITGAVKLPVVSKAGEHASPEDRAPERLPVVAVQQVGCAQANARLRGNRIAGGGIHGEKGFDVADEKPVSPSEMIDPARVDAGADPATVVSKPCRHRVRGRIRKQETLGCERRRPGG